MGPLRQSSPFSTSGLASTAQASASRSRGAYLRNRPRPGGYPRTSPPLDDPHNPMDCSNFRDDHLALNRREGRNRPFMMYFSSQAIHVPHTPPIDFDGDPKVLDRPVQGITGGRTSDVLYELARSRGSSPGGEHIVDQQHTSVSDAGISMNLECVCPILERVRHAPRGMRQLTDFSDRDDPDAEKRRDRPAEKKSSALDGGHQGHPRLAERCRHCLACSSE